jgi:hypothetical protein
MHDAFKCAIEHAQGAARRVRGWSVASQKSVEQPRLSRHVRHREAFPAAVSDLALRCKTLLMSLSKAIITVCALRVSVLYFTAFLLQVIEASLQCLSDLTLRKYADISDDSLA